MLNSTISRDFQMVARLEYGYKELSAEEQQRVTAESATPEEIGKFGAQVNGDSEGAQATHALIRTSEGKYFWKISRLVDTGGSPKELGEPLLLRGRNVYYNEKNKREEYKKAAKMAVGIPFYTFGKKIILPILVILPYLLVRGLSALFGRCEWLKQAVKTLDEKFHCEWMWTRTVSLGCFKIPLPVPVRAVVGVVAHFVIGMLAMIPGLTNYFSKINGDIERFVNGHTDEDLRTKSSAQRNREIEYKTLCQQPLFQIADTTPIQQKPMGESQIDFVWIHKLQPEIQRVALRTLYTENWASAIPMQPRAPDEEERCFQQALVMDEVEVTSDSDISEDFSVGDLEESGELDEEGYVSVTTKHPLEMGLGLASSHFSASF